MRLTARSAREGSHITEKARRLLPRQRAWEQADLEACSWVYLEVNAGDGRHTRRFFDDGNGFLEEYLRSSQAAMHGFCAVAVETDPPDGRAAHRGPAGEGLEG